MKQRTEIPGPDWLGPHLDDLLDSGAGTVGGGRVDVVELDYEDKPARILSASYAGVVDTDFVTDSRDQVNVYVTFYPWRSIARVRDLGGRVQLWPVDHTGNRPPPSAGFEDDGKPDEPGFRSAEDKARDFVVTMTRLMRGAR